jgi:hypothetical protein
MGIGDRLRRLGDRTPGVNRRHYIRGTVETVPDSDFVSQWDAADELGVATARIGWRIACGHLEAAEDGNRTMGVTRRSLDRELAWLTTSKKWAKVRRSAWDWLGFISP